MEQGKIEHGFYVQGDLKFAVDLKDAHKTFDAVAALSNVDKIKLAKLNDIKAEPYNRQALTTILKSVVQNAWFIATTGNLPTEVFTGHQARLQQYNAVISLPASSVDLLARKSKAEKTRVSLLFTIDPQKYEAAYNADHNAWRGQRYLVIASMIALGAGKPESTGVSVRDIFDNTKETRETAAPTRNAVGQIVNALKEAGIVTCLNPEAAREKAAPKPKATTPAPNKKKH